MGVLPLVRTCSIGTQRLTVTGRQHVIGKSNGDLLAMPRLCLQLTHFRARQLQGGQYSRHASVQAMNEPSPPVELQTNMCGPSNQRSKRHASVQGNYSICYEQAEPPRHSHMGGRPASQK